MPVPVAKKIKEELLSTWPGRNHPNGELILTISFFFKLASSLLTSPPQILRIKNLNEFSPWPDAILYGLDFPLERCE